MRRGGRVLRGSWTLVRERLGDLVVVMAFGLCIVGVEKDEEVFMNRAFSEAA